MAGLGIKYNIETTPALKEIASQLRRNHTRFVSRQMKRLGQRVHKNIQNEAPVRTGALRKSIVLKQRSHLNFDIMVDRRAKGGKYEPFVRLGVPASKINPILPRKKKALWWPGLPHPIKAVYNHPGIKANNYWDRGLRKSETDINATERKMGEEIERSLVKK